MSAKLMKILFADELLSNLTYYSFIKDNVL